MMNGIDYRYDREALHISESINGDDIELTILISGDGEALEYFRKVRAFFDADQVYTDVLFYAFADHEYRVIVKQPFYIDFMLQLFRHRLLLSLEWI